MEESLGEAVVLEEKEEKGNLLVPRGRGDDEDGDREEYSGGGDLSSRLEVVVVEGGQVKERRRAECRGLQGEESG